MLAYILRRIALMIPTIVGILFISFVIVQFAPGGPVERILSQLQGTDTGATSQFRRRWRRDGGRQRLLLEIPGFAGARSRRSSRSSKCSSASTSPRPSGSLLMLWNYARFDFGRSYFSDQPVLQMIEDKLPVSISLGLWMTLISYLISIPLGIRKAVTDGSSFDIWSSAVVIVGYAVPSFLFAVLLVTLFCGSVWQIFPLRGLTSDNFDQLSLVGKVGDYLWHICLPILSLALSAFATITNLTKNSFLDEIKKSYVQTARMKGLSERRVLYGHVFRNAMMIVVAGFPGAFISAFFSGALLIEMIFSLDGLGLLSFNSVVNRDYPVVFANLYILALVGLVVNLLSDLTYTWIDPRIDFERREV